MKSFIDQELNLTVEVFDKDNTTYVRIRTGAFEVVMTMPQFQRIMAFGSFWLRPQF
jgi:hypothetical protein